MIVEGRAEKTEVDDPLLDEYERKYTFRAEKGEGWYRVVPKRVLAWTEKDFPRNATRFDF